MTFYNTNYQVSTQAQKDTFLEMFKSEIEKEACIGLTVKKCEAKLLTPRLRTRRLWRQLQVLNDDIFVEYEIIIKAICSSSDCRHNAQAIGNALYDQVTGKLREVIENGTLGNVLKEASNDVDALLGAATTTGDFSDVVIPILAFLLDWYPDWPGRSGTCLNE